MLDYNNGYGDNANCFWILTCTTSSPLVTFFEFNTESGYDYVRIFNGPEPVAANQVAVLDGPNTPAPVGVFGGNAQMYVQFTSDGSVTRSPGPLFANFSCGVPPPPPPEPAPPTSCDLAIDLSTATSPLDSTTSGVTNDHATSCGGNGNEVVFMVVLQPNQSIDIGMSSNAYDSRHETRWGGECPGANAVACTDDPDTLRHQWTNDQSTAQTVYFTVDAWNTGSGTFTLTWTIS